MNDNITTINLWQKDMVTKRGFGVNCYLIKTANGFVLIDTGLHTRRRALRHLLEQEGVRPGNLRLIIATHGDADHCGNAKYLRKVYRSKVAMHRLDIRGAQTGNPFLIRNSTIPSRLKPFLFLFALWFRPNRFTPDILLEEETDLSAYGLQAKILHTPGHTFGSVSILTAAGNLLCGDLFTSWIHNTPQLSRSRDDLPHLYQSLAKVAAEDITTVYPGHGNAFSFQLIRDRYAQRPEVSLR